MKSWKHAFLVALVVITVLSLLLSACGPVNGSDNNPNNGKDKEKGNGNSNNGNGNGNDKEKGNANNNNAKDKDKDKGNDVKDKNKDNGNDKTVSADKVTICHRTGSAKHPYVEIRIANDAAKEGHAAHTGDLIPAPEGGCPATAASNGPLK